MKVVPINYFLFRATLFAGYFSSSFPKVTSSISVQAGRGPTGRVVVVTTNTESAVQDQHREKLFRRISYSIRKINRVAPFIPKCSFRRSFAQTVQTVLS